MQKDFIDELIEDLLKLKEKKTITISAPPMPREVVKVLLNVASKHNITAEELGVALGARAELTKDEIELLRDLGNKE